MLTWKRKKKIRTKIREDVKTIIFWNSREKSFLRWGISKSQKSKYYVESLGIGVTLPFEQRGPPKELSTNCKLHKGKNCVCLIHRRIAHRLVSKSLVTEDNHVNWLGIMPEPEPKTCQLVEINSFLWSLHLIIESMQRWLILVVWNGLSNNAS